MPVSELTAATAVTRRRSEFNGVVQLELFIGGSMSSNPELLDASGRCKRMRLDCSEELRRFESFDRRRQIKQLSLGDRETLQTLFRGGESEVAETAWRVANMEARDGCGGSPAVAHQAARRMVEQADTIAYFNELVSELLAITGAHISAIELTVHGSLAGGTCAGALYSTVLFIVQTLASFQVPIKVRLNLFGALSYANLAPLAGLNFAATLGHVLALITDKTDPVLDLVVWNLHLLELPPLGQNRQLRSRLLALDEQALRSHEMKAHLTLLAPNAATNGELGNILSREATFFDLLPLQEEVIPTVAASLADELDQQLDELTIDVTWVESTEWLDSATPLSRLSVDALIDRAANLSSKQLIAALTTPGCRHSYRLLWSLGTIGQFDLEQLSAYFCQSPLNFASALHRLRLLRMFSHLVDRFIRQQRKLRDSLEDEVAELRGVVQTDHQLITQRRWFRKSEQAMENLAESAAILQEAHDELLETDGRIETLQAGQLVVQQELAYLEGRFKAIRDLLERYEPRGSAPFAGDRVTVMPLDEVFPTLLEVVDVPSEEQQATICGMTKTVTLQGLAAVVGAPHPKIDEIAHQIVYGKPWLISPPHGASRRCDSGLVTYSLPPVADVIRQPLKEAIARLHPRTVIVYLDSMKAGVTVIRHEFRSFQSASDLYVGHVRYELDRVRSSCTRALRFPTGIDLTPPLSGDVSCESNCAAAESVAAATVT